MENRFSQLYRLNNNLYVEGSPILIVGGALLKDNKKSSILAQLKFKNITNRNIVCVNVVLIPKDISGTQLGEPIQFQYLDINIHRDEEFGTQTPIYLPDSSSRSFSVLVSKVGFEDKSIWENHDFYKDSLSQESIRHGFTTSELKEFKKDFGESAEFKPVFYKDIWCCSCGAINSINENKCHLCSNKKDSLSNFDMSKLKIRYDQQIIDDKNKVIYDHALEALQSKDLNNIDRAIQNMESLNNWEDSDIQIRKLRDWRNQVENIVKENNLNQLNQQKKIKKNAFIAIAVTLCVAVIYIIVHEYKNANSYQKAMNDLKSGNYAEAEDALYDLGEYKDSEQRYNDIKYYLDVKQQMNNCSSPQTVQLTLNKIEDTSYFEDYDELSKYIAEGVKYQSAWSAIYSNISSDLKIDTIEEVQILEEAFNKIQTMPVGNAVDRKETIKQNLNYLEVYSPYLGKYYETYSYGYIDDEIYMDFYLDASDDALKAIVRYSLLGIDSYYELNSENTEISSGSISATVDYKTFKISSDKLIESVPDYEDTVYLKRQ